MTERTDWELRLLAGHAALRMLRDIRDFGHSNGLPFAWETVPALTETEHRRFTDDAVDWLVGLLCSSLATVEHIHDLDMGAIVEDATLTSPITPPPGEGLERVVLEGGERIVAHTAERCDGCCTPTTGKRENNE